VRCWRYREVLATQVQERTAVAGVSARSNASESLLSGRDLTASYGPVEVLHGVSLDLWPHECLALVGESGSGKTTLAKCMGGLHPGFNGYASRESPSPAARVIVVARCGSRCSTSSRTHITR
jgi:peptide/nickel transport system ATP-binding protein